MGPGLSGVSHSRARSTAEAGNLWQLPTEACRQFSCLVAPQGAAAAAVPAEIHRPPHLQPPLLKHKLNKSCRNTTNTQENIRSVGRVGTVVRKASPHILPEGLLLIVGGPVIVLWRTGNGLRLPTPDTEVLVKYLMLQMLHLGSGHPSESA